MHTPPLPLTQDLVLIGGGHTHALVLRKWGMSPLPGARLTVINPGPTAPYSGMLPGFVAGHYAREELDIDLVRLARFAGARIIVGSVQGIDTEARQIHLPGRPSISFDVASINVGITSDMPTLPGFSENAVPAKPLGPFATRWSDYLAKSGPAHVAVIGGGVAGAELAMAMAHALRTRQRPAVVSLIDSARALTALGAKAAMRIRAAMSDLGVDLIEEAQITQIEPTHIDLSDGRQIASDFTTGAAGARAYEWMSQTGLELHEGFIAVDRHLQSSDPALFAAGDCAHLRDNPRPKAGVYAVREAPILFNNLRAALGAGEMRAYTPQKDYLKLISLGQKSALGERFGIPVSGGLMWKWKDHIDQTFMNKFRILPQMQTPAMPKEHASGLADAVGGKPLCGGCGAKVGRTTLQNALRALPTTTRTDITPLPGDDAAVMTTGGIQQVMTSDHLRSLTEDPVTMTRIAAIHALGDIWAMGADPQAATATLILPRLSPTLQHRTLEEIMTTATAAIREAGAEIVGGHTSIGDELTIGFTLTGLCSQKPITLAGGQPGDVLILTKPLGSGVIMAAQMAGVAKGEWVASALDQMVQPQGKASRILKDAHAMTDVTGFGLAGHLVGLCEASGCGAKLDLEAIPVMRGAVELSAAGIQSSLFLENRMIAMDLPQGGKSDLLFDPQTAGGLLAAISADQSEMILSQLKAAGYQAACVGVLTETPGLTL